MTEICDGCGKEFKQVGMHWRASSCSYPQLSNRKMEIIAGVLMGDGCINTSHQTPNFQVQMTNEKYLEFLDDIFENIGQGVDLKMTAKESAEVAEKYEFIEDSSNMNFKDSYLWYTKCHPDLQIFANWYLSGEKVFPETIILNPTILKHWYVCDGTLWEPTPRLQISCNNEMENKEKINNMFSNSGIPSPSYWNGGTMCWNVDETKELLEYMGEPLPGFEYKWMN